MLDLSVKVASWISPEKDLLPSSMTYSVANILVITDPSEFLKDTLAAADSPVMEQVSIWSIFGVTDMSSKVTPEIKQKFKQKIDNYSFYEFLKILYLISSDFWKFVAVHL